MEYARDFCLYSITFPNIVAFLTSQRTGPSYRSGPAFCPTLNATDSEEILVSSGVKKVIRVKVHIIGVSNASIRLSRAWNPV